MDIRVEDLSVDDYEYIEYMVETMEDGYIDLSGHSCDPFDETAFKLLKGILTNIRDAMRS